MTFINYRGRSSDQWQVPWNAPLTPEKREQDDDRDRDAKQPEKNATSHFLVLQRVMEWA